MRAFITLAVFAALASGCATPSPREHFAKLSTVKAADLLPLSRLPDKPSPIALLPKNATTVLINEKSPVTQVAGKPSYFQVFKFVAKGETQVLDVKATPYKPFGFGQIGIVKPVAYFYDEAGQPVKSVKSIFFNYDRNFVMGEFLRGVWKVSGLSAGKTYFALIASDNKNTGEEAKSVTNYGAAMYGVVFDQNVQYSPVGRVTVLVTDKFKR